MYAGSSAKIGYVNDGLGRHHATARGLVGSGRSGDFLRYSAKPDGVLCVATRRKHVAVPAIDTSKLGVADTNSILQHGCKHRLQDRREKLLITWSTSDVAVCCSSASVRSVGALGEVVSALTEFVEQPRVLDGDDSLGSKVLHKRDLFVGERMNFSTVNSDYSNKIIVFEHWHSDDRANSGNLDRLDHSGMALGIGLCGCEVIYVNSALCFHNQLKPTTRSGLDRTTAARFKKLGHIVPRH